MNMKLYVGNLSYNTTENDLQGLFSQAGTVTSVAVIKDNSTGLSKGFAFIEMDSQTSAQKAISLFNNYSLSEQLLVVNFVRSREERVRPEFKKIRHRQRGRGKRHY